MSASEFGNICILVQTPHYIPNVRSALPLYLPHESRVSAARCMQGMRERDRERDRDPVESRLETSF